MDTLLFLLCCFITVILYTLIDDLVKKHKKRRLPGPISFPVIGSALQVAYYSRQNRNSDLVRKLCGLYGPVIGFKTGVQNYVFVEDYQTAKQMLSSDDWSGRYPETPLYLALTLNHNCGILFSRGEPWRNTRKFAIQSLIEFGFSETTNLDVILEYELKDFMTRLNEMIQKSPEEISFHQAFNLPVLNILWSTMCGTRFSCNDIEMQKLIQIIEDAIASSSIGTQPMYAFPFLRFIPGMTNQKQLVDMFGRVQEIFREMIKVRRESATYLQVQNDFVDKFIKKIDEYQKSNTATDVYTDDQLIQSCTDLLLAGSDTSANALEFGLLYMMKYPKIQQLVQNEIDHVIGPTQCQTMNDKLRMPYTEATILEILRFANIAPVDIRASLRDTEVCGIPVPKNTIALINLSQMHKDPIMWPNPSEFRPERFIDENNNIVKDHKLLVFGGGKRVCLGKQLAKCSIFGFFTSILQKYNVEVSSCHPEPSIESVVTGVTAMPKKFYCRLTPRRILEPLHV